MTEDNLINDSSGVMRPEAHYNGGQAKVVSSKSGRSGLHSRVSYVVQVDICSPPRIGTSSCNEPMLHLSIIELDKLKNGKPCVCQVFLLSHPGDGYSRLTVKR